MGNRQLEVAEIVIEATAQMVRMGFILSYSLTLEPTDDFKIGDNGCPRPLGDGVTVSFSLTPSAFCNPSELIIESIMGTFSSASDKFALTKLFRVPAEGASC